MRLSRIISVAAALSIGATLATAASASATTGWSGDYKYSSSDGVHATIEVYSGSAKDITIPATLDGYTVTTIGVRAFENVGLTSVVLPNTLLTLDSIAFKTNHLTSIAIPASVTRIESDAFSENDLTSVTVPAGVTAIGALAFAFNPLTSVILPPSVTSIGAGAFQNGSLSSITIPANVTTIGDNAFKNQTPALLSAAFLGNAPSMTATAFSGAAADFTVSYLYGNTGFGTDATWLGFTLKNPGFVQSASAVTAGITAGARTATLTDAVFDAIAFSHSEQNPATNATLLIDDLTGANAGWNVTEEASALTWSAVPGGPSTGVDLDAGALSITTVGAVTTTLGDAWSGTTATGALNSPVKILSTSGGNGSYSVPLILTLTIPGQASVGHYAGTITTTISTAP